MRRKNKKDEQKTTRINSYNNIHQTHQTICDKYRGQEDLLPRIDKILVFLNQHDISNCPLDDFIIDEYITKLKKLAESIKSQTVLNQYLEAVTPILNKYDPLSTRPVIFSFTDNTQVNNNPARKYIDMYNNVARRYHAVPILEPGQNNICSNCGEGTMRHFDNKIICTKCYNVIWKRINNISFDDKDRITTSNKYAYERPSFFKTWVKRYQGKHNPKIPRKVYNNINSLLDMYDIDVLSMSKTEFVLMLRDNGMSEQVENINFLYYDIIKSRVPKSRLKLVPTPPDLSQYESRLFAEYNIYDSVYDQVLKEAKSMFPSISRENSTNSVYTLYKLLERQGYQMPQEDKDIFLKCSDKIIEHDHIWAVACSILGWNFHESI